MDYKFKERCLSDISSDVAVVEFDLDDYATIQRQRIPADKRRGLRGLRLALAQFFRKHIPRLKESMMSAGGSDAIEIPDEPPVRRSRQRSREIITDEYIGDFVVKAIDWFFGVKTWGATISLKKLFVICRIASHPLALDAQIQEAAKQLKPKMFAFERDIQLNVEIDRKTERRSLILYFPPDAFGVLPPSGKVRDALIADSFFYSEDDKRPRCYFLKKSNLVPDVVNELIYPRLCQGGLVFKAMRSGGLNAELKGISIRAADQIDTIALHYKPSRGEEIKYEGSCRDEVPAELGLTRTESGRQIDILPTTQGYRLGLKIPSWPDRERRGFFQAFTMPIDVQDPSMFMPHIRIRGTVITRSGPIEGKGYRIDLEGNKLFESKPGSREIGVPPINGEDTFEESATSYVRKHRILYKSGDDTVHEDFYFCRSGDNIRAFSITSKARNIPFFNTFEVSRSFVRADGEETEEVATDASVERHFMISNTGILHETRWKFSPAPGKNLGIFQLCTRSGQQKLTFRYLDGADWQTDEVNLNGFYFIFMTNSVYIFDLKRTPA